ncbi:hypothetical protein K435DRAFT_869869 [Dendrothele bispora CBS 962.96]|uniref:Uncharacterized protein n=1 Tax=Dendrothele bispora (strain CBS 962.96) TaxID=1314807 RepID=A0A4S8L833_DENBC|nr:hypothetical protein K435DRAFT_869869 [Dendrothele bispora CBS 962.96]
MSFPDEFTPEIDLAWIASTDRHNVQHFHARPVATFFEGIRTSLLEHVPTYLADGAPPTLSMKLTKLIDSWASKLAILAQSLPNHANKYPIWFTGFLYSLSELICWIYHDEAQLQKSLAATWVLSEKDRQKMSKALVMFLRRRNLSQGNDTLSFGQPGPLLTAGAAPSSSVPTAAATKPASPAKRQTMAKPAQITPSRSKATSSSVCFDIDPLDTMEVQPTLSAAMCSSPPPEPSSSSTTQKKRKRSAQGIEADEMTPQTKKGKGRGVVRPPTPSESSDEENTPVFELDNILKKASGNDVRALLDTLFEHVKPLQDINPKTFGRPLKYGKARKDKLTPYYAFHDAAEPPFFVPRTDRGAPFKLNVDTLLRANEHVQPYIRQPCVGCSLSLKDCKCTGIFHGKADNADRFFVNNKCGPCCAGSKVCSHSIKLDSLLSLKESMNSFSSDSESRLKERAFRIASNINLRDSLVEQPPQLELEQRRLLNLSIDSIDEDLERQIETFRHSCPDPTVVFAHLNNTDPANKIITEQAEALAAIFNWPTMKNAVRQHFSIDKSSGKYEVADNEDDRDEVLEKLQAWARSTYANSLDTPGAGPSSGQKGDSDDEEEDDDEGSSHEPPAKRSRVAGPSKSTSSSSKKTPKAQDKLSPRRSPRKNLTILGLTINIASNSLTFYTMSSTSTTQNTTDWSAANQEPWIEQATVLITAIALADHLSSNVPFDAFKACPPSVAKYKEGFKALEAAIGRGDIGIINAYTGIKHFYRRLTAPPATVVPKGKGTKSKKVVKSSAIVQDDDEEEVQVITSKETSGGDVEMASGLEVSIHAPPKVNSKEAKFRRIASSICLHYYALYSSHYTHSVTQSQTARSSSNRAVVNHELAKRMRVAGSASDFSEPKPEQEKQLEKEIGNTLENQYRRFFAIYY